MIGVDYTAGPGHAPGVGRYVRELVRALVRLEGQSLRLTEFGRAPVPMEGAPLGLSGPEVIRPVQRTRLRIPRRILFAQSALGDPVGAWAGRGCGLFHRVHPDLPRDPRVPHSIAVAEFPAEGTPEDIRLRSVAQTARGIIVFSADARQRAATRFGVDENKVFQVPVGAEHWTRELPGPVPLRPTRDILVLGAIRSARRPLDVLRAFEALRATGERARLLIAGRRGDAAAEFDQALSSSPVRGDVRWIDNPTEARMPACVAGASVLLHFAVDEVSAVTPLEATRMGLPVVASDLPAFREVLGPAAHWADPSDPAQAARALAEALSRSQSDDERQTLREHSFPFTWDASARAHDAAWEIMLRAPPLT